MNAPEFQGFRDLVATLLEGPPPEGPDFDLCRGLLRRERTGEAVYQALCMLLEGALADPSFDIEATQTLVRLLRALARGAVRAEEVIP